MKHKILAVLMALTVAVSFAGGFVNMASADKNSPPDESIPETVVVVVVSEDAKPLSGDIDGKTSKPSQNKKSSAKKSKKTKPSASGNKTKTSKKTAASEGKRDPIEAGVGYFNEGRYQMAINYFEGLIKSNPHSADAWYWIARARHAMGDYDKAQAAVNIALEIDPHYGPLSKSPSGLEPVPPRTKEDKKEPRPSMSVLPVKQPLPSGLWLEPVTLSFPYLINSGDAGDLRYAPYPPLPQGRVPVWMSRSEKWNEIGRWRYRVDRIGILKEPRVPIAWKGARPVEVYFWTGKQWARVVPQQKKELFDDILFNAREDIKVAVANEGPAWNESDTPALAATASLMRYFWVGDVDFKHAEKRAAELAKRQSGETTDEKE